MWDLEYYPSIHWYWAADFKQLRGGRSRKVPRYTTLKRASFRRVRGIKHNTSFEDLQGFRITNCVKLLHPHFFTRSIFYSNSSHGEGTSISAVWRIAGGGQTPSL